MQMHHSASIRFVIAGKALLEAIQKLSKHKTICTYVISCSLVYDRLSTYAFGCRLCVPTVFKSD